MQRYKNGNSLLGLKYTNAQKRVYKSGFNLVEYGEIVHNISAYARYNNPSTGQTIELSYDWIKTGRDSFIGGKIFGVDID